MARPRRLHIFTIAALAALAIAGCGGDDEQAASGGGGGDGPVKIGAALPLTGDFSAYAETWRNGMKLAVDEINQAGGIDGRQIEVVTEDWASDDAKAVSVFTKLANVDKVPIELGGGSGAILAQSPIANRSQTVLMNSAAQTPEMREGGDFVFSNINDATVEAEELVRYMKEDLGISEALIYYVDNPTGEGGRAALEFAAEQAGVTIIDSVAHSFQDTNYRTVLSRIKQKNPPAILVASHWENTGLSLKQAEGLGLETTWLGLSPTVSDVTVEASGKEAIEGFYTVRSEYDVKAEEEGTPAAEFVSKYEEAFGKAPDIYAAHFYDAVYLIKAAVEKGATDGPSMQKTLAGFDESSPHEGVTGATAFDQDGMVRKDNYILVVKDGKPKVIE
jgi:branched-chain amino acid transport system substrate-binding protein